MAPQDTTVIFVPGAWHEPEGFDSTISYLHKAGYNTSKVYTPSVIRSGSAPCMTFDPDVQEIRKHIRAATHLGRKVILVMHSYAGQPGSEAMDGFDQATFASQGHTDGRGVVHAVYLASFMLRKGQSLAHVQPALDWITVNSDGTAWIENPAHILGYDFDSQAEIDRWVSNLKLMSLMPSLSELTYEPWRTISTTYLVCENDRAISADWQREYIQSARDAGARDLNVVTWSCGHTPFGVYPEAVSKLIRATVGDVDAASLSDVKVFAKTEVEIAEVEPQIVVCKNRYCM